MDRKIYALIPAYEPDKKLTELCRALTEAGCTVVVVDDGSDEGYAALFDGLEAAIVLTHIDNLGKGAALKTGLRYISEEGQPDDIVVTADADGRFTPEDILCVANAAKDAPDALALGCRSIGGQAPLRMHALRDAGHALREALRFAAPTLASFTIDCASFALFLQLTAATGRAALPLANTLARTVSASASFAIFRRISPRDDGNGSAALRHVMLSAGLLAASTALLIPLAEHINIYEAKLAAEGALFTVNLLAQCLWQFKRS